MSSNREFEKIRVVAESNESYKALINRTSETIKLDYNIASNKIDKDEHQLNQGNRLLRNIYTTSLYRAYVAKFYQNTEDKKTYKNIVLGFTIGIWVALTCLLIGIIIAVLVIRPDIETTLAVIIPECVTYVGSLFGILEIIAKHAFPTEEEKYVNEMVKTIIETDQEGYLADKTSKQDID